MSKLAKFTFTVLDLMVIFMLTFGSAAPVLADASPTGATVTTQLPDYPPGATVLMTGAGWAALEAVHVIVNDQVGNTWTLESNPDPVADDSGGFTYEFQLPNWFVATYLVTANGYASGTATVTFTDLSIGTYDQCSNDTGTGYTSGDTGCRWINGNLQSNNSIYFEGDATVQRVWLTGFVPGSTHTLTLKYGTTKGGKHAYDFLTRWDWSESWITVADRCQGIGGCETASENALAIPLDPNANGLDVAANLIKPRQFIMRGGTLTSATTPTIVSGDYSGDSETSITVNFTVANSGDMCPTKGSDAGTCGVALWFGAHVAAQANWGLGLGAGSISGSPYHVALDAVDNTSVGQRDNQMQAGVVTVIPNGKIVIVKDAQPDDPQDFSFNLQNNPLTVSQDFKLDDDGGVDVTLPTSQEFSVPPGTWLASELSIPTGWTLAKLACTVAGTNGSSAATDLATAKATITLKSNDTVTCTFTDTKNQGKDLKVTKTATPSLSRLYNWSIDKTVDKTTINIADGGKATFNYSVKVTPGTNTDSGWKVSGQITVDNPNGFPIAGVSVADAIDNGGTCSVTDGTNLTIPANDNVVLDYSCTYAAAPTSNKGTNTATATWTAGDYYGTTGSASGTASVDFSAVIPAETNKTITVVDDKTDPSNPVTLGTWNWGDGEHTFTYSLDKPGVAGKCTDYTNTAVIDETDQSDKQMVTVCVGKDLTVTKTATASRDRTYKWLIDKSVNDTRIEIAEGGTATFNYSVKVTPDGFTDSGYTLGGTITINNPNEWEDIAVDVADTLDQGGTCSITESAPYVAPKGDSLTLHYTCTTNGTTTKNTAIVTWNKDTYSTPSDSASNFADVSFTIGTETNKTITVIDDKTDPSNPVTLGTWNWGDGEHTFTYSLDKPGVAGKCTDYTNTAVIDETKQSDKQIVTVCVGKDLTVTKTAAGTFDRTYLWKISKDVDQTLVKIAEGGDYTFKYTVDVEQTGVTDAGWALSGKITITNPNDWEDIMLTDITDIVDNGGTCTVDPTLPLVPKGGSVDVNYSCSFASAPSSYTGKNTVTVNWDKATAFTPTGSAAGTADFILSQLGDTNKTVHVTDSFAGTLGTVTATDAAPFATATFTYDRTESGVAGTCTKYDNTAKITETDQTADKSVTLCVAKDLTVTKTAAGTFDRTYLWKISKDVDQTLVKTAEGGDYTFKYTVDVEQTGVTDAGWTLSGKITITNPNDFEDIMLTGITDIADNGGTCTVDPTLPLVAMGKSVDVSYTCSFASAPSSYTGKNTATVTWNKELAFTPSGSATGFALFALTQLGSTNQTVHVTDSFAGTLGTVTATDAAPFAKGAFTYDRTESGVAGTCTKYDNTAKITETGDTASKQVTLCVAKDLTVTKTATGTFDRTYKWLIDKSVDHTGINIAQGGIATFNYIVKVTPDGYTDSGWTLGGTITITNPNDWEAITADVTDSFDGGGICTVMGGNDVVVPAGKSVTLDYSCVFATQPAYTGKNTATATWDKISFFTPTDTGSGTADVTIGLKGETNRTITVMDDKTDPANPVILGTSDFYAGSFEFKYALDKQGVAGTCKLYTNTAVIKETDQSATKTVKVCVGVDLRISKTAVGTLDRTYHWLIDKSVDKTRIDIADSGTATFNYSVLVKPNGYSDSNYTLGGTITLVNPNDWQDMIVSVVDTLDQGGTCSIVEHPPYIVHHSGIALVLHYTCTTDGTTTKNTATATWSALAFSTPHGTASADAPVSFDVANETYKTITVVDDKTDLANPVTLGDWNWPDGPHTFTYSLDKQGVAGTCTEYTNTATIKETGDKDSQTVKVCVAKDLTVTKTAAGTFDRTYNWKISKDVNKTSVNIADGSSYTFHYTVNVEQTGVTDAGWTLSGKITITNPNDWEDIMLTGITDVVDNGGICTVDPTLPLIEKGKSVDVAYSCTFPVAGPTSYSGKNTATVTWNKELAFTPSGSATGSATFALTQLGSTDKTVNVTDSFAGALGTVTATDAAPFAKGTFTYDRTESGVAGTCTKYDNTATITETDQTASKSVTLCVAKDLTVTKTAAGTFDREYLWSIDKSVDKNYATTINTPVTFNYKVLVSQTGIKDSGWNLSGKITITNSNDWEDITLTSLTDVVDNGGNCTVAAGPYTVLADKSIEVNYSCTYISASALSGKNTATANWDATKYFTPSGSASGTADFTLTQKGSTNKTVTVTDTNVVGTLGTVTANDAAPWAFKEFKYSRTINPPANKICEKYDNTATIVETKQSDTETVQVCLPSLVTDSSLCTFDYDTSTPATNDFRLLFTPTVGAPSYKLNATNPGQFYYNIFYSNDTDQPVTPIVEITLPYPFVTQGAVPVHAYSGVIVKSSNGQYCLTPVNEIFNTKQAQVTLDDYSPKAMGSTTTLYVELPQIPAGGFVYTNIHLDYGLKGSLGYGKDGNNNAVAAGTTSILIPNLQTYGFADNLGLSHTVQSINVFKKNPGVGGQGKKNLTENPIANAKVQILDANKKVVATIYTDIDGWYMWAYKYTGKAATFYVTMPEYKLTQTITLKSNGYVEVYFTIP